MSLKLAKHNKFKVKIMQFFWTIDQIPELQGLSKEQTKEAWQFCYKKYAFKHWQSWVSLFALGILAAVGSIGVWKKLKQKMDERHIKRCPNIGQEKSKH
jgi:hypothetical protein